MSDLPNPQREDARGGAAALVAYLMWGTFPLYFNRLADVPAVEVLAHRVVWGAAFSILTVLALRHVSYVVAAVLDRKRILALLGSTLCITANWGFFIWAVANGHAIDASIGYFINPLFSVVLGAIFLKERLQSRQLAAVVLVGIGVGVLAWDRGGIPWIALALPLTFGFYGLIRKIVAVDTLTGFAIETLLAAPIAIAFLATRSGGGALVEGGTWTTALLVIAGPVTAVPLLLFGYGARRLKLATLGLFQYVNPTIQGAIATFVFGEVFTKTLAVTFALIWTGLVVYTVPGFGPKTNRQV